jgi:hypothetical protein
MTMLRIRTDGSSPASKGRTPLKELLLHPVAILLKTLIVAMVVA